MAEAPSSVDEPRDQTRQRALQACQRCRLKKVKCDGKLPQCDQCHVCGPETECVYSDTRRMRGPGKSKQRIEDLQQRLADIESLLGRSDLSAQVETIKTLAGGTTADIDAVNAVGKGLMASNPGINTQQPPQRQVQSRTPTGLGPAAAHFKRLADLGTSIADTENPVKPPQSLDKTVAPHHRIDVRTGMLRNTAEKLFDDIPLFVVDEFRNQLEQPLRAAEEEDHTWTACLNALMGFALRLKAVNSSFEDITVLSREVFQKAHAALPNILGTKDVETALQAVLAMIMYLRTSANISLMALLLCIAVRLSQMLSQEVSKTSSTAPEVLQRLCSITWLLDSELSLNHGYPSLFSSEPIDLKVSAEEAIQFDHLDIPHVSRTLSLRTELAFLQARTLSALYHNKLSALPHDNMTSAAAELDSSLRYWHSSVPSNMKVESYIQPFSFTPTSSVRLHIAYNNCLTFVHWPALRRHFAAKVYGMRHGEVDFNMGQPELGNSIAQIRSAARAIIKSFYQTETLSMAELWPLLYYALSANIVLLACVLQNPCDSEASYDKTAVQRLTQYIANKVNNEACSLQSFLLGCVAIETMVRDAIAKAMGTTDHGPINESNGMYAGNTQAMLVVLCTVTHPMRIACNLMGNLSNTDYRVSGEFLDALGIPRNTGKYGVFVCEGMKSEI